MLKEIFKLYGRAFSVVGFIGTIFGITMMIMVMPYFGDPSAATGAAFQFILGFPFFIIFFPAAIFGIIAFLKGLRGRAKIKGVGFLGILFGAIGIIFGLLVLGPSISEIRDKHFFDVLSRRTAFFELGAGIGYLIIFSIMLIIGIFLYQGRRVSAEYLPPREKKEDSVL